MYDLPTFNKLGYGFVRLKSPEAASSCIVKLNNFPFNGRNLIANKAQKKAKLVVGEVTSIHYDYVTAKYFEM